MCRFLVYKGSDEILLSKLILDPTHSILTQSFDSRLRLDLRRPHNGDGFGIGYYTDPKLGSEPCIFTSTTPAWNCINLQRIASKTASSLIFAHVRATTEGSLSDDNCHPFCHGSLMWMHNGGLGGWKHIKRRLGERLADRWYMGVQGGTDSEWAFALYLDTLERMGHNPSAPPTEGFGPTVLRKAMLKTIAQINDFIANIPQAVIEAEDLDIRSLLNFAITDGHSVVCTRYVSSKTDEAASLYYSSGTTWEDPSSNGEYQMDQRDKGADIVLVASEPLTFERESWVTVPTNSTLTIHKQTVMVHPIIDENYSYNPYHSRSSQFAREKGLVTNEKNPSRAGSTPSVSPPVLNNDHKAYLAAKQPASAVPTNLAPALHAAIANISPPLKPVEPNSLDRVANESIMNADIRHPSPLPTIKFQEQGNTKKKRRSLAFGDIPENSQPGSQSPTPPLQQHVLTAPNSPQHPPVRTYGDPAKIAKFFPELNYSLDD